MQGPGSHTILNYAVRLDADLESRTALLVMTEFFGACPLDCPDGCSWVVTVEDGVATNLRGNRDHPYTAGALCAKVNGYLEHTRSSVQLYLQESFTFRVLSPEAAVPLRYPGA